MILPKIAWEIPKQCGVNVACSPKQKQNVALNKNGYILIHVIFIKGLPLIAPGPLSIGCIAQRLARTQWKGLYISCFVTCLDQVSVQTVMELTGIIFHMGSEMNGGLS